MPAQICMTPWRFAVEPFNIAANIYYVGNRDVSAHLVDTGAGLILIDTAFPQTVYLLLESVRKLGYDPRDIAMILNIHGHYDHFGGTRAIKELTGAETYLGEQDIDIIHEKPELSWASEYGVDFYEQYEVDHAVKDGDTITMGNTTVECVHSPGHTRGTISYFFEVDVDGRKLKAGMHGGPGLNTLSSAYMKKLALPAARRDIFLNTLQKLKKRHVDIQLGAHPGQTDTLQKHEKRTDSVNPFIDGNSWPRFLSDLEEHARRQFREDPL